MAYTPNPTWQDTSSGGTPITASKLNRLENGLASALTASDADPLYAPKVNIHPKDYGFVGNGSADDAAALNAAAAAAKAASGLLHIPPVTCRINSTVTLDCHVSAVGAVLRYYGTGTALIAGTTSTSGVTFQKQMLLPRVEYANTGNWDGTSVGVILANLNTCDVYLPGVRDFETGLRVWGYGQGCVYNTVRLGYLQQNRKHAHLSNDSTGWANQNTFIGGRFSTVPGQRGAANNDSGAWFVKFDQNGSASGPNNNVFYNASFEGDLSMQYGLIFNNGRFNLMSNCRYETSRTSPAGFPINYTNSSVDNAIARGYDGWKIIETFDSTSTGGTIQNGLGPGGGPLSGTYTVTNNTFQDVLGWSPLTHPQYTFDPSTGLFTVRPGMWNISCQIMFAANTTGLRRLVLVVTNFGTRRFIEVPAAATGRTTVQFTETFQFTTAYPTFKVQAYQNSGADLTLDNSSGCSRITLTYLP